MIDRVRAQLGTEPVGSMIAVGLGCLVIAGALLHPAAAFGVLGAGLLGIGILLARR